jgi:hypothetical protein
MFDYQAGEKYKLTLIMVAVAGLLAGIFFTMLLMPSEAPASRRRAPLTRAQSDPDVTGGSRFASAQVAANMLQAAGALPSAPGSVGPGSAPPANPVDRAQIPNFMSTWLPRVWDLGAETASNAQEWAIAQMTPNCAAAYRHNIWTEALAKQVQGSGLQSAFVISTVEPGEAMQDGSCEVKVKGIQTLSAANGQQKQRVINVVYMVVQTPEGMKIAGISDGSGG